MPRAASLCYEVHGEGPPVVLVPGLALDRWFWRPMWRRLPHLRLYSVDLPRFSQGGGSASVSAVAATLADWHATVGLAPCPWVGHSLGGQVGVHLAADHADVVTAVVLLAPSVPASYTGHHVAELVLGLLHEPPTLWWQIARGVVTHGLLDPVRAIGGARADDGLWEAMRRIAVPTLVAYGARDAFIPARRLPSVAAAIRNAQCRPITGAHHTVVYTHPDPLARLLGDFLRPHAASAVTSGAAGAL